jgi:homoserine O-succinyltransferase
VTVRFAAVTAHGGFSTDSDSDSRHLTCAFVNNMPDGAFDATERQYFELLEEVSGSVVIDARRYTMAGVPRGDRTSTRIGNEYFPIADIYREAPDLLIVTGSNPIEESIEDELYWPDLVELLSWARDHVDSSLLSCLAAHAALNVFDGAARRRLSVKCTGIYSQHVDVNHPLTAGFEPEILLPHSRWNSVPRDDVERAGYVVVIHSEATGWGVASREEEGRHMVLIQAHPEYDPSSLLREYRRDAGRFVHGEREDPPILPLHCVSQEDWVSLEGMHRLIVEGRRDPDLVDQYPFDEVGARAPWPWRLVAKNLFSNWLSSVNPGGN